MDAIYNLYKELLHTSLTAEEIEAHMIEKCGYTWQEIKLAQEYCTPPEKKNYWVDKPNAEWPDCEPTQDWDAVRPDMVNSPTHYTKGGIETIDYIQAKLSPEEYRGYLRGNLLKYASRMGAKGEDDAGKAAWYAKRLEML